MNYYRCIYFGTILMLISSISMAQNTLAVEVNAGPAFSNDELVEEVDLNNGFALEGLVHYRFLPHLGAYGGWGWTYFPTETIRFGPIEIGEAEFREVGYRLGLEFSHEIKKSRFGFYARAGGVYSQIRADTKDDSFGGESDWDLDWQASVGLSVQVGSLIQIRPGFRYHYLERELEYEAVLPPTDVNITYYVITLGVVVDIL